jgi:formate--tetrahydrofolate ligase
VVNVREVRLAAGAEFVVMICGDIMTMPGLPKVPSACAIDVTDDGKITGSFEGHLTHPVARRPAAS